MSSFKFLFFAALTVSIASCSTFKSPERPLVPASAPLQEGQTLTRIAFGSCANQDAPQPIWNTILKDQPDLFVFTGDNVYASYGTQTDIPAQYDKLSQLPDYVQFRAQIPMMAIWDDHDYGLNDSGFENPKKEQAKSEFLRHFPYAKNLIPAGAEGVYHAKTFGSPGKTVQIILLDTRWNRSALVPYKNPKEPFRRFQPTQDPTTTILGNQQWKWLEEQLQQPADLRLIISSIQLIPDAHGFEKWGNFPHEKKRFFDLLKKYQIKNSLIISGDRHIGTLAQEKVPGLGTITEITASSINRPAKFNETDPTYLGAMFPNENYGLLSIDWKSKKVILQLKSLESQVVNKVELSL